MCGKWINIISDSASYKKVNGFGVKVTGESHMLLEVKACRGAEIQLQEVDTGTGSWLYCKLGGDMNEWTAVSASELCDDAGCGWLGYDYQPVLDCDNFKPFWLSWDVSGTVSVGRGNALGSDVLVTETITPFEVNFFMVSHSDASVVAEWKILIDEPPTFISPMSLGTTVVDVSEDTPTGVVIYTVSGTDNEGDALTFTLATHDDVYELAGGALRIKQSLDYETLKTYRLLISMSDGRNTQQAMMTVRVTNVVDETPVITLSGTLSIPEEMPVGSVVSNLFTVDDKDERDTHTYAISGRDSTFFSVDATSGVLKIARRIDRDQAALTSVSFDLTVKDSSGLGSTRTIAPTIVDINDNNPAFSATSYTVDVAENTPIDTVVLDLVVTDADDGTNAASRISLQAGTPQDLFSVTGSQLKTVTSNLDYESLSVYEFVFTVIAVNEDNLRTGTTTISVKVTPVNEFDPVFDSPAVDSSGQFPGKSLSEDVPVNHEISFAASDADLGVDGDVTFSFVSVLDSNGDDSSDKFEIGPQSGVLKIIGTLDSDTPTGGVAYHDVTIRVTDGAVSQRFSDGTIRLTLTDVNDNMPKFDSTHYAITVNEDIAVGDLVASVTATDDDGDSVTLTLEGRGRSFELSGSDVILKYPLDYSSSPLHVLTITADDETFTTSAVMTVTVVDVVTTTLKIVVATNAAIPEDQEEGTVLTGVFVTHGNTGAVTYSLEGTNAGFLSMSPVGELSYSSQRIDRDGSDGITTLSDITVKAVDSSGNEATADLTFVVTDINDNAPLATILAPTAQVRENSQNDQLVTSLYFTDADEGVNSNVTLHLVDVDVHDVFKVVDYDLFVRGNDIDYEAMTSDHSYDIVLHAVDNPVTSTPLTSTVTVHVQVLGENEYDPSWTSPTPVSTFPDVTIKESATLGETVETFVATDDDGGVDGEITYSVVDIKEPSGASVTGKFEMTTNGRLVVASQLDYDADTGGVDYYIVTVAASDSGSTSVKSTTGDIKVILEDVEVENVIVLPKQPVADTTSELWVMRTLVVVLATAAIVMVCVVIRSIDTLSSSAPGITKPPDKFWMERTVSVTPHMSLESVIIDDDDDSFTSIVFRPSTSTTETSQPSSGSGQGNDPQHIQT